MRYIHMYATTPYCGTDDHDYLAYEDDTPDSIIDEDTQEFIQLNSEGYEYLVGDDFFDEPDEDDITEYYESCDGGWEEITYEEYLENC